MVGEKFKSMKKFIMKSALYNNIVKKDLPMKLDAFMGEIKKKQNKLPHIHIIRPLVQLVGPAFLVLIVILFWKGSTHPSDKGSVHPVGHPARKVNPISVVVASAESEDVPVYLTALGTVTPFASVTLKTQLSGQLTDVLFKEGQMVKKGELLIKIDSRFYEAQLLQYEGQLARDVALLANAKLDLKRYKELIAQDSVSRQIYETQVYLVQQYEGTVKLDQGLVDSARVNVSYCNIHAPTDGRVGLRLVDPGNLVQPSDTTGMLIVDKIQPISVVFTLAEDTIPQVMKRLKAKMETTIVEAYNRSQNKLLSKGKLLTMDNQVDTTTGTVRLRAEFENEEHTLFPNQFVNAKLLVDTVHNATVVPTAAVQNGVKGTYVYLLMDNSTVKITPVTVGVTTGNTTVITSGVVPGQIVVTEGADKLTEGAPVIVPSGGKTVGQTK